MVKRSKPLRKNKFRLHKLTAGIIIAAILIVAGVEIWAMERNKKDVPVAAPSSPVNNLPKQAAAANKSPTTPTSTVNQGGPTDESGQSVSGVSSNSSQWSTSSSGAITLKSPLNGGTLKSGDTITGSATVSSVQYTLIDNQLGVISGGPISVNNGTFTATISFTNHTNSGRLDVFSTEPNGKEINEVQISVSF